MRNRFGMAVRHSAMAVVGLALALSMMWLPLPASAIVLQSSNAVTGNQAYSGVGVRFDVNTAISVTDLGIYDSDQDGIAASPTSPLSTYLMTDAGLTVTFITFDSVAPGTLDLASKYRFKAIVPVTLLPGTYILVGYGWTGSDPEHNCNNSGLVDCETFNDGAGLLTYIESPFGGGSDAPGTKPTNTTGTATNFFSASNMIYDAAVTAVPEPASVALLALGLAGLAFFSRRRKA